MNKSTALRIASATKGICLAGILALKTSGTVFAETPNRLPIICLFPSDATPLCVAISKGEVDFVKKMVAYGANINERSNGLTPLMVAARFNNVEIVKFLLDRGANPKIKDEKGFTALRYAELSNAKDAAALLKSTI